MWVGGRRREWGKEEGGENVKRLEIVSRLRLRWHDEAEW